MVPRNSAEKALPRALLVHKMAERMGKPSTNGMDSDGKKVAKRQFYPEEIVIREDVEGRLRMRGRRRDCAGLVCALRSARASRGGLVILSCVVCQTC